ncbi:hypothetical protein [Dyella mobilis]|uniref:Uncharacterized protein n=1 Tax=Dyella mobilis TaxID=1849582 RepID=A0ABS2KJG1_9GAMM|nr:hypothetical protein [Dyella mobilis]MBM7131312.1 hypothetical protein [Dyella mobilis]
MALQGRLSLNPLRVLLVAGLFFSYVTSFIFVHVANPPLERWIISFGESHLPVIEAVSSIATNADHCSYVMTIQWMVSIFYALVMIVLYCPFSTNVKIATRVRLRRHLAAMPSLGRAVIFVCFVILWFCGDLGLIGFPTFLNGKLLVSTTPQVTWMIKCQIFMPFFAWFVVIAEIMIYWVFLIWLSAYLRERKRSARLANFVMRDRN